MGVRARIMRHAARENAQTSGRASHTEARPECACARAHAPASEQPAPRRLTPRNSAWLPRPSGLQVSRCPCAHLDGAPSACPAFTRRGTRACKRTRRARTARGGARTCALLPLGRHARAAGPPDGTGKQESAAAQQQHRAAHGRLRRWRPRARA